MTRFVVHESGVIFDASECVVVDTDLFDDHDMARLSGDDYFDDGIIAELANRCGVAVQGSSDGARWNAFMNTPIQNGGSWARAVVPLRVVPCASCDNVGAPTRLVDPRTAPVVPWDVMGDCRAFAFVCDECASGLVVGLSDRVDRRREYAREILDITDPNLPDEFRYVLGIDGGE